MGETMRKMVGWMVAAVTATVLLGACRGADNHRLVIVTARNPSPLETLAAKEFRRYYYLRTGRLAPIEARDDISAGGRGAVAVLKKTRLGEAGWLPPELRRKAEALGPEEYLLKTVDRGPTRTTVVIGGDEIGTLYGAYRLAENLGVRFYLHGDVIPDARAASEVPEVDETDRPLFRLRGIHPFHDFPEGPDWWSREDYLAVVAQLPKLRLNFLALHTYPEPIAEPTVWIGQSEDIGKDGAVRFAYPASYQNTLRGNWGYETTRTSTFHFGAAQLFDRDDFGSDVMRGLTPWPKTPEGSEEVFRRTGLMLRDAFDFGRRLGVKSCVGTEMPLMIPESVKKRLLDEGKDPGDPRVVEEIYRGVFGRIKETYPLDYYWLWTNENWTWEDASPKQVEAVAADARTAIAAAAAVRPPFSLATCGWVLGPPSDRALFDRILPKNVAESCINREVGKAPVDPMFARISGRSKWAIPWLEDDPGLTSPQLWAGRMRKDAADALAYGCDGLLGIHWRTRVLGPNIAALAHAAWDQEPWGRRTGGIGPPEGPLNGVYIRLPKTSLARGADAALYRDYRDRVLGYRLKVPDGTYEVTLQFIEGEMKAKNARVFDVVLQGKRVLEKLDIFARVGEFRPLELRFAGVDVTDGTLAIDFADRIHYPAIAGIVVRGKGFARKINCGGPAGEGYDADWPESPRFAPVDDFYADWAAAEFGEVVGRAAGAIFSRIDGRLPQINVWTGPGGLKPDPRPWSEAERDFRFVEELAGLRPGVEGPGNAERFDYWLNTFLYYRETARLECLWGEYEKAAEALRKPGGDRSVTAAFAEATLVPLRERLAACLKTVYDRLLATVSNTGELGTIANWEQHLVPSILLRPNEELTKILGRELAASAGLGVGYAGAPRLIVPAARTLLAEGEPLTLKVLILAAEPPTDARLCWRPLGRGEFRTVPLERVARSVYKVMCDETRQDLEYFIRARVGEKELFFPATAPEINQTVVRQPS